MIWSIIALGQATLDDRLEEALEARRHDDGEQPTALRRVKVDSVAKVHEPETRSSNDDRALAIRDHLLPLVRDRGTLECQRDAVRLITLQLDPWLLKHWTPFNDLSPEQAASPGYRHALARQRTRPELPYGLEVWRDDRKVLSVLWAQDGSFEVDSFVRGSWER